MTNAKEIKQIIEYKIKNTLPGVVLGLKSPKPLLKKVQTLPIVVYISVQT